MEKKEKGRHQGLRGEAKVGYVLGWGTEGREEGWQRWKRKGVYHELMVRDGNR